MKHRIDNIDYLRGLLAVTVMLYHFDSWSGGRAASVLGSTVPKLGIYAVCAFYVISGIVFGHMYRQLGTRPADLVKFYVRRAYRIAPLYWVALLAGLLLSAALALRAGRAYDLPSWEVLALNFTLTFGLVDQSASLVVGGWSIGCEVAFYLAFPLVALALRRGWMAYGLALTLSWALMGWFAFAEMDMTRRLVEQWSLHIHPLNQSHFFISGVGVAVLHDRWKLRPMHSALALAALGLVFVLYPMGVFRTSVAAGWPRVLFSALTIASCAVVYLTPGRLPALVARPLAFLGIVSFSIYLLHPLVYRYTSAALAFVGGGGLEVAIAIPLSVVAGAAAYRGLEAPVVAAGKRHAARLARLVQRAPEVRTYPL